MDEPDLRIVLLGKTGVGKSASGNTILADNVFESRLSFKSVTTECSQVTKEVFEKKVSVVDTPGVSSSNEEPIEMVCQRALESSTPCLFLALIEIGRFTEEDHKVANIIKQILGPKGMEKCYILFTKGDALGNSNLDDFIFEDGNPLPKIIHSFGGKYHVFNNEIEDEDQVKELLIRSGHLTSIITNTNAQRMILLGRSGVGKSATGNTILGLRGPDQFKSTCSFNPVTSESEAKTKMVDGREITVIDTPGLSDRAKSSKVYDEVMKAFMLSRPGPHAFILVFELNRVEKKDLLMIDLLKAIHGKGVLNHTLVLFTHSDNLCGQNIKDLINENETAKSLLDKVGGRYCVFDNKATHMKQVRDLFKIIDEMVPHEESTYYKGPIANIMESISHEERQKKGLHNQPSPIESDRTPLIEPSSSFWQRFKMWCAWLWECVKNYFYEISTAQGKVVSECPIRTLACSTIG